MPVNPKIEAPLRTMLGYAIRDELDDLARVISDAGAQVYESAVALAVQASAYITIDALECLPVAADLKEVARLASGQCRTCPLPKTKCTCTCRASRSGSSPRWRFR